MRLHPAFTMERLPFRWITVKVGSLILLVWIAGNAVAQERPAWKQVRPPRKEELAVPPPAPPPEEKDVEPFPDLAPLAKPGRPAKAPAGPAKVQESARPPWLPYAVFGTVSMMVFAACWLALTRKEPGKERPKPAKRAPATGKTPARKGPPPLPFDVDETLPADPALATAICAKTPLPTTVPAGAFAEKSAATAAAAHHPGGSSDSNLEELPPLPSIARTQPPYFHARAVYALRGNHFYRVYILPDMLLFLDAGSETNDEFTRTIAAAGAVTGGIVGAVVGQTIGAIIDGNRRELQHARKKLLDTADAEELIRLAHAGEPDFRVILADVADARIEPTSVWHSMQYFGHQYVGLFCFRDPQRGELTLEIPTLNDMKAALAELPKIFGEQLDVNVVLDRANWQYVRKHS